MSRLLRVLSILLLASGSLGGVTVAQSGFDENGSITLQVFNCPADVNRDNFDPAACELAVEGFDFAITYNVGQTTLSLSDATFDGESYTWGGLLVAPGYDSGEGDPTYYHIVESPLPDGFSDYIVDGTSQSGADDGLETDFSTRLVFDQPDHYFAVYNFVEAPPAVEPATISIYAHICPYGYEFVGYDDDCGGDPASGEWFRVGRAGEERLGSHVVHAAKSDENGLVEFTVVRSALRGSVNLLLDGSTYETNGQFISMDDITEVDLVCSNSAGEQLDVQQLDAGAAGYAWFGIPIQPGDNLACRVYNIRAIPEETSDQITFRTYVVTCEGDPGVVSEAKGNIPPEGCVLESGTWISVSSTDGTVLGECVTGDSGACDLTLPDQTDVIVTEDEDTIPSGYAPRDNPINTRAETEFAGAVFVNLPVGSLDETATTVLIEPTETPAPVGRPAHIHAGVCGELKNEPRYDLTDLTAAEPVTPTASPSASKATEFVESEVSISVIDVPLTDLLSTPFAINVHQGRDDARMYLVCGNIAGPVRNDGSIAVGLKEVDGSGYIGVAYLRPAIDNEEQTEVLLFLLPDALAESPVVEMSATPSGS